MKTLDLLSGEGIEHSCAPEAKTLLSFGIYACCSAARSLYPEP